MIDASDRKGWWGLVAGWALLGSTALAAGVNDTGQTTCYNDTGAVSSEPSTHPRQDCTMGRDAAAAAGVLSKTGAGSKGFDFTKIANDGSALPASATSWRCVRDNLTGLLWEVKTDDGGLQDKDWTYSWYNPDSTKNGGNAGVQNGGSCTGSACDTYAYVQAVNAQGLCGYRDWRLPKKRELQGLVDYGIPSPGPGIDTTYFPNTRPSWYWSSSVCTGGPQNAWYVNFYDSGVYALFKALAPHVRLVRGGQ